MYGIHKAIMPLNMTSCRAVVHISENVKCKCLARVCVFSTVRHSEYYGATNFKHTYIHSGKSANYLHYSTAVE